MFELAGQILFAVQQGLLFLLWPMAVLLIVAAIRKPYIPALTIMAIATAAIALGVSAYQFAVLNMFAGYPVDQEVARTILRAALLGVEAVPVIFFLVYRKGFGE